MPPALADGRYVVTGFLGEGARKRVYLGHDSRLDRDVAVAVIPSVGADPAARERIHQEARAMARLGSHPNIVTVHDFGEEGDVAYIVSEYMAQGSVADLLAAAHGSGLEGEHAVRLAGQVAAALAHAHRAGLVHRDVKPANVFLNEDGDARLGDFGVALALDRPRLTSEGRMVGTVDYMSPEQALGREVDERSDLYSLGAMLYELVCGRPPFRGDDIVAVVSQHINSPPVAPSWHRPDVPAALERLILALLAKPPDERPASAEDVGRALAGLRPGPAREAEEANPLGRLAQGQFVGRRDELERLRALLDGALSGRGALALVAGEPGIGKTRLVEELAAYGGLRGARVLWGRCYEGDGAPAYWPWVQIVRAYLAVRPAEAWAAEMGAGAADIARVVPEAGAAAGEPAAAAADESPEEARFRFFEAMGSFARNAAADRPLVLVLDDLHWADASSLLLLGFLAQEARSAPVLVVGTYRDIEVDRDHPLTRVLGDVRAAERITLAGLPERDVARFLEARSGAAPHPRLVAAAYARTEGNPFFLSEVMRLLVSEGGLDDNPERALAVPAGVRDVLARRLDRLSEGTRKLLGVAAVIGRDFGLDVVQRAAGASADEVLDALDEAVEAQVLVTGRAGRFRFNHALVRETVYDEVGTVRRLRLHLKVGEALEAVHGRAREAHVAELAHHWFEALPLAGADKAVDYSAAAARRSHAALAFEEAARHYDRACRALELAGQEDDPRRIELLLARGEEQTHAGEVESSHETFREAAELASAQDLPELQARAALGFAQWSVLGRNDPAVALLEEALAALPEADSSCRAEVLAELAIHLETAEHRARKDELSAAAVAMARRVGDRTQLALLLANRHATIWGPDNLGERLALADEGLALALEVGDRSRERWAHFLRFVNRLESGDVATADRALDEFARTADELGQPFYRWYATLMRRTRALMDGAMADAERLRAELEGLWHADDGDDVWARTVQDVPLRWQQGRLSQVRRAVADGVRRYASIPAYRCLLAWVDAETGRVDAARRELERFAAGGLAELPCDEHWLAGAANLAAAAAAIGDARAAPTLRERLAPHADRLVLFDAGWVCLGPCARYLGALAALEGDRDDAVTHLEHALAIAAAAGSRPWVAQTECDLARVLAPAARARELAEASLATARELGLDGLAERATALLRTRPAAARAPTSIDALAMTIDSETPARLDPAAAVPVTLLFSDIEGSTELNERLGDERWLAVLEEHNAIVRAAVRAHSGREVKSQGDGFMLAFARPADGLACALAMQRALAEREAAGAECPLRVRVGVHAGPAIRRGSDYFGRNVVVAARIAAQARGGEILVSEELREAAGAPVSEPRELVLKGLGGRQRVHAMAWDVSCAGTPTRAG